MYLKKFLESLNLILPHEVAHSYRGPAVTNGSISAILTERKCYSSLWIALLQHRKLGEDVPSGPAGCPGRLHYAEGDSNGC